MKRLVLTAALSLALVASGSAQSPQCPCTYTLSQEQRQLLQSMHGAAATWAAVHAATSRGTLDADAYEALRADYDAVMVEIVKQDRAAVQKREGDKVKPEQVPSTP